MKIMQIRKIKNYKTCIRNLINYYTKKKQGVSYDTKLTGTFSVN